MAEIFLRAFLIKKKERRIFLRMNKTNKQGISILKITRKNSKVGGMETIWRKQKKPSKYDLPCKHLSVHYCDYDSFQNKNRSKRKRGNREYMRKIHVTLQFFLG